MRWDELGFADPAIALLNHWRTRVQHGGRLRRLFKLV